MKMKNTKIAFVLLTFLIFSFLYPTFSFASLEPANGEIKWGVREGRTYTWIVKRTNGSLGFLPVDSEYSITVTSIRELGGGTATEINATITEYNSATELTTTLLDNKTFIYFDSLTNITTLYTYIDNHSIFIPSPDYKYHFIEGLMGFYGSFFNTKGYLSVADIFTFYGYKSSNELVYMWTFNQNGITDNFIGVFIYDEPEDESDFQYWLVLKSSSDSIPSGNFFLLFLGFAIISLLVIYRRKIKYS
jgi:hypothetical protein